LIVVVFFADKDLSGKKEKEKRKEQEERWILYTTGTLIVA